MTRVLLALLAVAGCYSPPEPDCGFACGPGDACPADYTCASDHHCHRNGAPASLTCGSPPVDAAIDTIDAPVRPMVIATMPQMDEPGAGVGVQPTAFFDQPIMAGPQDMYVIHNGTMLAGSASVIADGSELMFTPDVQLPQLSHFTVHITAAVHNAQGVSIDPYLWGFDTNGDFLSPRIQSSMPAANDSNVPVTTGIRVRFDEAVTGVDTSSFTASDGSTAVAGSIVTLDTRTYELRPTSSLSAASTITVSLSGAIKDVYGNPLAPVSFSFMTAP